MHRFDKIYADLKWALTSPPLVSLHALHQSGAPKSSLFEFTADERRMILARSLAWRDRLVEWIATKHHRRLGMYFEDLLEWALWIARPGAMVHRGVQVSSGGQTSGELDFILSDLRQTIHVEAAIKFYVYDDRDSGLGAFWGPQRNDRLDLKLKKICGQQLKLPVPQEYIAPLNHSVETRAFLRGMLFYGWDIFSHGTFPTVTGVAHHHLRGWWVYADEAEFLWKSEPDIYFLKLDRLEWVSPIEVLDMQRVTQVLSLESEERHVIFVRLKYVQGRFVERDRGFLLRRI